MESVTTFSQAAERHLDDVYGYLVWFTGDRVSAEDLTGETFERALRLWHRFDERRGTPRTWLCQVARLVAAEAAAPRRQLVTWRRELLVAGVAGAAVAAGVIATRPSQHAASNPFTRQQPYNPGTPIEKAAATDHFALTGAPTAPSPSV